MDGSGHWPCPCKDQAGLAALSDRLWHLQDSQKHYLPPSFTAIPVIPSKTNSIPL